MKKTFFHAFKKNTDINIICASIVFKTKTNKKYEENVFKVFYFKIQKCAFLGVTKFVVKFFLYVLAFETIEAQKRPKWRFWQLITFFGGIFKNTEQNNICVFIVFKGESEPKHEEIFFFF